MLALHVASEDSGNEIADGDRGAGSQGAGQEFKQNTGHDIDGIASAAVQNHVFGQEMDNGDAEKSQEDGSRQAL